MPVAKLSIGATPAAMKADEGNDPLDTLIRQAMGKEPLFSFSRTGDGPVQWIQLLNGLEQQGTKVTLMKGLHSQYTAFSRFLCILDKWGQGSHQYFNWFDNVVVLENVMHWSILFFLM